MKNYLVNNYIKNRNNLSILLNKTFRGPISNYFLDFLKDKKIFIVNKREDIHPEWTKLYLKIKKGNNSFDIFVTVSEDHLIALKFVSQKNIVEHKTRVLEEALAMLEEFLQ